MLHVGAVSLRNGPKGSNAEIRTLSSLKEKLRLGDIDRRGFLTSAAQHGASLAKMKEVSRHKSTDVLLGYVHDAELFRDHAGSGFL